ncbi:LLM class flavin-dependent oxidoreductase [soil metagenome]
MVDPAVGVMFRCQSPPEKLPGYAQRAERAGFDELWVVEDCFFTGGVASAAVALANTDRIEVGLGIVPAVARNVAFTAMEVATLARLYPGRILPGIGHGVADWMRQVGAAPESQLNALEEVVASVRALLRNETVSTSGDYANLDGVILNHPPEQVPPVYTGVRGPRSLALSGRVADGTILAECAPPAYVLWARDRLKEGAEAVGHTDQHRLTVYALCKVDRDSDAARRALRPAVAEVLASGSASAHLAPMGIEDEVAGMVESGGVDLLIREMPDEWLDQLAIVGSPDECAAAIGALAESGADSVVLIPSIDQPEEDLDAFKRELLPVLGKSQV